MPGWRMWIWKLTAGIGSGETMPPKKTALDRHIKTPSSRSRCCFMLYEHITATYTIDIVKVSMKPVAIHFC